MKWALLVSLYVLCLQAQSQTWVCGSFSSVPAHGQEALCEGDCMLIYDSAAIWNNAQHTCTPPAHRIWTFTEYDTANPAATAPLFYDTVYDAMRFYVCDFPVGKATVRYHAWDSLGHYTSSGYLGHITVKGCPPLAAFGFSKDTLCTGNCIQYTDSSRRKPLQWQWQFEGGEPATYNGNNPPPVCYPNEGAFTTRLITRNNYGTDTAVLTNVVINCDACAYIPNAFTPNADGHNDYFGVYTRCPLQQVQFSVYNRWGTKVFHSLHAADTWNGQYLGAPAPAGVYTYLVQLQHYSGRIENHKGTVTLFY